MIAILWRWTCDRCSISHDAFEVGPPAGWSFVIDSEGGPNQHWCPGCTARPKNPRRYVLVTQPAPRVQA